MDEVNEHYYTGSVLPALKSERKHFLCATNNALHLDAMPGKCNFALPSAFLSAAALLVGFLLFPE